MSLALFRWSLLLACLFTTVVLAAESRPRRQKAKAAKLVRVEGGHRLHRDTATALQRMTTEALKDEVALRVTSGYRSLREQRILYEQYRRGRGNKAARPGRSNHQRGLAVDLVIGQRTSKRFLWLEANACRFGFRRTVPSEPWHWEYRPSSTFPPVAGFDCLGNPTTPRESPAPVARTDAS